VDALLGGNATAAAEEFDRALARAEAAIADRTVSARRSP
jgi:hypothetical protein